MSVTHLSAYGRRPPPVAGWRESRWARLRASARTGLWLVPGLFLIGSIVFVVLTLAIDRSIHDTGGPPIGWVGDARNAEAFLATLSGALLVSSALMFFITVVAMQLATMQASPRLMTGVLRDRATQVCLGIYVGTFTYCMLAVAAIEPARAGHVEYVPRLSVTVGVVLGVLCVAAFIFFVSHMVQNLRIVTIIDRVADEGYREIERADLRGGAAITTAEVALPEGDPQLVVRHGRRPGVLTGVDAEALVALGAAAGCVLVLVPGVGDYVGPGYPLVEVFGPADRLPREPVADALDFRPERSMEQDPSWAVRQLVDIAQRALSPSVNDPTTAVQAIDRVEALLHLLVVRPDDSGLHLDDDGELRLVVRSATWDGYVELAFTEVRRHGWDSLQIIRRLRAMADRLLLEASPARKVPLETELAMIDDVLGGWPADSDLRAARRADPSGMGAYRRP